MSWRRFFRRRKWDEERARELASYLETETEENIARGMMREEANRAAHIKLGNTTRIREEIYEMNSIGLLETLWQDLHYGARMLRKNPGFTIVAVLTLALGIGANTAIFSVIDSVLLRPLPYKDSDHLVILWENDTKESNPHNTVAPPDFLDWQSQNTVFTDMAGLVDERDNLTGNGEPEQVVVQLVTPNFFAVLGVNPLMGRGFIAENSRADHRNVVILAYGFWKERFGGDPGIIGKIISINGHSQTVVGVAPPRFDWFIKDGSLTGAKPQMWAPWVFPERFRSRKQIGRFMTAVARIKPGVSLQQAQTQMNAIGTRLAQEYPDFNSNWGVSVVPLREQLSGNLRPALLILLGAVAFVLLIACANVSSLLLARAASRERELAIRTAIGASRSRIARQLLTESALLAAAGGGLGVLLAFLGTNVLLASSPQNLLGLNSISINFRILAFAGAATLLTGFLFGFLPSYISAHARISETLKEGSRTSSSAKGRQFARSAFVVAQMGLSVVLLIGAGLLIRSFARLVGVDPGFDSSHLITFKVTLPGSKYGTDQLQMAFFDQLLARIGRLPGVRAVSTSSCPPFSGLCAATAVHLLSQPDLPLNDLPVAAVRVVGPNYFRTMAIPLRAGRTFNDAEMTTERHVVIVNQAFADKYLPGKNPLGEKAAIFMKSLEENKNYPSEIIGVVGDVREIALATPAEPTVYWPYPELVYSAMTIVARTSNDPLTLVSAARTEVQRLDPDQPISGIATMDQLLGDSVSLSRFTTLVLGVFAAIALVLAAVGIYGVITYTVAQRTHEMGIRMALGAQRADILRLVLGQGTRLTLLGVGIGTAAALALTRLMASLLYKLSATDPVTFAGVAILLTLVAILACYMPARHATRVDPVIALRHE